MNAVERYFAVMTITGTLILLGSLALMFLL